MANPPCASQDGNPAVFIGTILETGDTVALCDMCLVAWSAALLNTMTGVDPTPFLMAVSDDVDGPEPAVTGEGPTPPVDVEGEPAKAPANGRRGRTSAASPAAGTAADPAAAEEPPATVEAPPAA
jgi:hypothetical protein